MKEISKLAGLFLWFELPDGIDLDNISMKQLIEIIVKYRTEEYDKRSPELTPNPKENFLQRDPMYNLLIKSREEGFKLIWDGGIYSRNNEEDNWKYHYFSDDPLLRNKNQK